MNNHQLPTDAHLNAQVLDRLIDQSATLDEQRRAEAHLDHCSQCGDQLSQRASSVAWWNAASRLLSESVEDNHRYTASDDQESCYESNQILALLAPTDDPRMLGRLGCYEIVSVIGSGGMGVVLKGFDSALNRYVAIKTLRPGLAASATSRQRFAREGQAAASVLHENVIAIHGVDQADGIPYLVMPYVRGESLGKRLSRTGPFALEEMLRIGHQVASGLAAAHAQGLIHRDVKPSNILMQSGIERLLLTDFGLARAVDDARLTVSGTLAGTPEYMSPEQAKAEVIDARSDLYSLGSVLWTLAVGRPPFVADSCYGVIRKIIETEPHPIRSMNPSLPDWFAILVERLMEKRAEDRFQTADHVAHLFQQCTAHVQNAHAPLPVDLVRRRSLSMNRVLLWSAVGLLLCILIVFANGIRNPSDELKKIRLQPIGEQYFSTEGRIDWNDGSEAILSHVQTRLAKMRDD